MKDIEREIGKKPWYKNLKWIVGIAGGLIVMVLAIWTWHISYSNAIDNSTPRLEIAEWYFRSEPFPGGNNTGLDVIIQNQGKAWARDVRVDFINDDGYSKYEKLAYFDKENYPLKPEQVKPGDKIISGWRPQGPSKSPEIYKDGSKKYVSTIFIDWKNDKDVPYSLVAQYESVVDNFVKGVHLKEVFKYDSISNKAMVKKMKQEYKGYLPKYMLNFP